MKRMMKSLVSICLALCLLPTAAFAVSNTYYLEEAGIHIDIPSEHVTFTRDTGRDDPNLREYGLTADELYSLMLDSNIYLDAWDEDINYEILVTMTDSDVEDLSQLSDAAIAELLTGVEAKCEDTGITFMDAEVYRNAQAKFVMAYTSRPNGGDTMHSLQYFTICDNKDIGITLHSFSGKINENHETMLQDIVDSIRFDTPPQFGEKTLGGDTLELVLGIVAVAVVVLLYLWSWIWRRKARAAKTQQAGAAADAVTEAVCGEEPVAKEIVPEASVTEEVCGDGPVPEEIAPEHAPEEPKAAPAAFCHHCGSRAGEGAVFCHKCGTRLYTGEEA